MPGNNFFKELKRRNVYKVAITYGVTAWLLSQMAGLAASSFGAPEWVMKMIIITLLIGFPLALILAWAFEMSPEGIVRTTSSASVESTKPDSNKKTKSSNFIIGLLFAVVIGQFIFNRISRKNDFVSTQIEKSIAVMPFNNLSLANEHDYFSDGMMAEIINKLFRIDGLMVTSRTTSMNYRNSNLSARQIAKELGVAHILEGDVVIVGNNVRVLINLIDGKSDASKWTDEYNTTIDEIFNVQTNIAQTIAEKLKIEITPQTKSRIASNATDKPEVWRLLMKARFEEEYTGDMEKAANFLEEAISMDPEFAPAYADLGFIWLLRGSYEGDLESGEVFERVNYFLENALRYDPDYPQTHVYLALNHLWYNWDFKAAEKEWNEYYRLIPPLLSGKYHDISYLDFLNAYERSDEALIIANEMIEDDASSADSWSTTGLTLYFAGQPEAAIKHYEEALNLFTIRSVISEAGRTFVYTENYDKAIELLEGHIAGFNTSRNLGNLSMSYYHTGQIDKANEILDTLMTRSTQSSVGSPAYYAAQVLTQMKRKDDAFKYLDKAYVEREVEMYWLNVEPPFKLLHGDPRWKELITRVGLSRR